MQVGHIENHSSLGLGTWESPYAITWIKNNLLLLELEVSSTFMRAWVVVYGRSAIPPQPTMQHNAITFYGNQLFLLGTEFFLTL
ncbi:hypothetical protein BT93_C1234 [Corymbia citriodora subsp. variegata]|nr:hypothetical protein BT93_C1234 [Corymbia citriodora subsp. variegata]